MKLLKNRWFALAAALVMVAGAVCWSLLHPKTQPAASPAASPAAVSEPASASAETLSDAYIRDDAGLFSLSGEKTIRSWNNKLAASYGGRAAVYTTASASDLESETEAMFDRMGLGESDMLLGLDTGAHSWYVELGASVNARANSALQNIFRSGAEKILSSSDPDDAADELYEDVYDWYRSLKKSSGTGTRRTGLLGTVITIVIVLAILRMIGGGGRRGGGGGGRFVSGLFLGSLLSGSRRSGGFRSGGSFRGGGFGGRGGFGGGRGGFGG